MVDVSIDLQNDPERPEAIELARGWVSAYLVASSDGATADDLATYIAANALRLTYRDQVVTLKLLLHGLDYAAQTIRDLLGMCAYVTAEADGQDPENVDLFARIRDEIWAGTKGLDVAER
jgi:hypothetical protein